MNSTEFLRIQLATLLMESLRRAWRRRGPLALILLAPAVAAALVGSVGFTAVGFSRETRYIDISTTAITLTDGQRAGLALGGFFVAVVLSLAMAATVQAVAAPERISARHAFGALGARGLQIFWLQWVVIAIALRLAPWAALLMWVLVGFGSVVAVRENAGPNDAMELAWVYARGNRLRLLLLEILLLAPFLAVLTGVAFLFLIPGPWFNLNDVAPWIRVAISPLLTGWMLAPVQFLYVARTLAYESLRAQPPLHARAAAGVIS
jgi:hypothetical protein